MMLISGRWYDVSFKDTQAFYDYINEYRKENAEIRRAMRKTIVPVGRQIRSSLPRSKTKQRGALRRRFRTYATVPKGKNDIIRGLIGYYDKIPTDKEDGYRAHVGRFLEEGTKKIKARRYVSKVIEARRHEISDNFAIELDKELDTKIRKASHKFGFRYRETS